MTSDSEITVSATISNTGKVKGKEVVQFYLKYKIRSVSAPDKELKGFRFLVNVNENKGITINFKSSSRKNES